MLREVFIVGGARTPFASWKRARTGSGSRGGALAAFDPAALAVAACRGALERTGIAPAEVDRLNFGNMYQVGPHACYGGRYVSLGTGLPPEVPSVALNMACGTGLAALIHSAREVAADEARTVLCAGADCPSRVEKEIFAPSFFDEACGSEIGATVEPLAAAKGIDGAAMDAWALESHRRARRAAGSAAEEIVPVDGLSFDDAVAEEPDAIPFAAAKRTFGGGVSARNTHAIVDGASALLLDARRRDGTLGRFVDGVSVGIAPARMGVASVPAIRALLEKTGRSVSSVDLFEINETFAAQLLLDAGELSIPPEKLNVNGGAIAFGHPFAATGGKLVLGLLLELRRRNLSSGIAAICVGGGIGVAVLVERL